MPPDQIGGVTGVPRPVGVRLVGLYLHEMQFIRFEGTPREEISQIPLTFNISTAWLSLEQIAVRLMVSFEIRNVAKVSVAYVATFKDLDKDEEKPDMFWRQVAARLAPTVIFPYVRETISSMAMKSGLSQLNLPVLNVSVLFDPSTIDFAPRPTTETVGETLNAKRKRD
jgi:preprotein translocase subunit SecB